MIQTALAPLPPKLYDCLGEFPASLFDEAFYRSWELVLRHAEASALQLGHDLRLAPALDTPRTLGTLRERLGFQPAFAPVLSWLVRFLAERDLIEQADGAEGPRYRIGRPLPPAPLAETRAEALEADPANAPALDLIDAAVKAYPAVAAGPTTGKEAMFGLGQTRLWLEYFDNRNPSYAINNRLAAAAAAARLPAGPFTIVELGGGGGSAAEALILELICRGRLGDLASYRFTEPSPFFRRRAERNLREKAPEVAWSFGSLDLNRPLDEQGLPDASADLIYAVNVLHVAKDLDAALPSVRRALRPGGWLVGAESIRPFAGRPIATELVFQLLEEFGNVALDPVRRPTPGFLTPEQWQGLLADGGFAEAQVLPDHACIREVYEHFFTGVVVGRRP